MNPAITALSDQASAIVRDHLPEWVKESAQTRAAIHEVLTHILEQAQDAEPDDRRVANTFYVLCRAWQEAVA